MTTEPIPSLVRRGTAQRRGGLFKAAKRPYKCSRSAPYSSVLFTFEQLSCFALSGSRSAPPRPSLRDGIPALLRRGMALTPVWPTVPPANSFAQHGRLRQRAYNFTNPAVTVSDNNASVTLSIERSSISSQARATNPVMLATAKLIPLKFLLVGIPGSGRGKPEA
jgi:hypothetical protein